LKLTDGLRKLASLALVEIRPQLNSSVSEPSIQPMPEPEIARRIELVQQLRPLYAAPRAQPRSGYLDLVEADDFDDPVLSDVLDLIEHEPVRGGFYGLAPREHDAYVARICRLLDQILADPTRPPV
jgi:hypothetical protein